MTSRFEIKQIEPASQAQMIAGSSTTVYTSPLQQRFHPSAAKAWVLFRGGQGSPCPILSSYNVSSVTTPSTGRYIITFSFSFSGFFYASAIGLGYFDDDPSPAIYARYIGDNVNTFQTQYTFETYDVAGNLKENIDMSLVFYGDV